MAPGAEAMITTRRITPKHEATLTAAGIPLESAKEWGIFSVVVPTDLDGTDLTHHRDKGYTGLCFPLRMTDGSVTYQLRLDDEHVTPERGKYIQAAGLGAILNVPTSRAHLVGKAKRIIITEGTKQTIAATLYSPDDVLVIGIQGCHNFSRAGVPLREIAELVNPDAATTLIFDADWVSNAAVWQAAADLKGHLEDAIGTTDVKVATVSGSGKMGLDDFLGTISEAARPGSLQRIIEKARPTLGRKPAARARAAGPATVRVSMERGVIERVSAGQGGAETATVVLGAAARITAVENVLPEEGAEGGSATLTLEVAVAVAGQTAPAVSTVRVESSQLAMVGGWLDRLPGGIGVGVGRSSKPDDEVATAIREADGGWITIQAHPRTGWLRDADGRWVFLHAGGAIGAEGAVEGHRARLAGSLEAFSLPDPAAASDDALREAAEASLGMLDSLVDPSPYYAIMGGIALAATGVRPEGMVMIVGAPGSGKSTVTNAVFGHLAPSYVTEPMSSFNATSGILAEWARRPRALAVCVDDYKPRTVKLQADQDSAFDLLTRISYDGSAAGRARLRPDRATGAYAGSAAGSANPLVVVSGEVMPDPAAFAEASTSGISRLLAIRVTEASTIRPGMADALRAPGLSGQLQLAYAGYLRMLAWVAEREGAATCDGPGCEGRAADRAPVHLAHVVGAMRSAHARALEEAFPTGSHRVPLVAAGPLAGLEMWLGCWVAIGVIDEARMAEIMADAAARIGAAALAHSTENLVTVTPAEAMIARIRDGVSSRRLYLVGAKGVDARSRLVGAPYSVGRALRTVDGDLTEVEDVACVALLVGEVAEALRVPDAEVRRALRPVALQREAGGRRTFAFGVRQLATQGALLIPLDAWGSAAEESPVAQEQEDGREF